MMKPIHLRQQTAKNLSKKHLSIKYLGLAMKPSSHNFFRCFRLSLFRKNYRHYYDYYWVSRNSPFFKDKIRKLVKNWIDK